MVPRLQNVLAPMRRDVVANPDRSRDHCMTNVEIERTGLWWGKQVNDQQGECYGKVVSIQFITQITNTIEEEELDAMLPILREVKSKKEMTELFNTIVCVEQLLTPSYDTIISAF